MTKAEEIAGSINLNDVLFINRSYAPGTKDYYGIDESKVAKLCGAKFRHAPRSPELDKLVLDILESRLGNVLWSQGVTR